jgi:hypothetical protein
MPATGRFYVCARCRVQVNLCRRCDRGQISRDGDSWPLARTAFWRPGDDINCSRNGRLAHAERMRRYRSRLDKVTHRGSAAPAADVLLQAAPTTSAAATTSVTARRLPAHCHFCQRAYPVFVCIGPLRGRVFLNPKFDSAPELTC